jgi:hypothetical protein
MRTKTKKKKQQTLMATENLMLKILMMTTMEYRIIWMKTMTATEFWIS